MALRMRSWLFAPGDSEKKMGKAMIQHTKYGTASSCHFAFSGQRAVQPATTP